MVSYNLFLQIYLKNGPKKKEDYIFPKKKYRRKTN